MEKSKILEAAKNTILSGYWINENYMSNHPKNRELYLRILTINTMITNIFGIGSEEEKEFDFYLKNFDVPFPQKEKVEK